MTELALIVAASALAWFGTLVFVLRQRRTATAELPPAHKVAVFCCSFLLFACLGAAAVTGAMYLLSLKPVKAIVLAGFLVYGSIAGVAWILSETEIGRSIKVVFESANDPILAAVVALVAAALWILIAFWLSDWMPWWVAAVVALLVLLLLVLLSA